MEKRRSKREQALVERLGHELQTIELDHARAVLTERGPLFDVGDVLIHGDIWHVVPARVITSALALHQSGYFGAVPRSTRANNTQALAQGGTVTSRWCVHGVPVFWVVTQPGTTEILLQAAA